MKIFLVCYCISLLCIGALHIWVMVDRTTRELAKLREETLQQLVISNELSNNSLAVSIKLLEYFQANTPLDKKDPK